MEREGGERPAPGGGGGAASAEQPALLGPGQPARAGKDGEGVRASGGRVPHRAEE